MNSTKSKIIAFDLADVLCSRDPQLTGVEKYQHCKPIPEMIRIANQCYDQGMYIKIYTARGMCTFNGDVSQIYSHLYELTIDQLKRWGVKYHQLVMGKIHYDVLIDDKALNSFTIESAPHILNFVEK